MEIVNVSIKARKADVAKVKADILAVGVFSEMKKPAGIVAELDSRLGGAIGNLIKLGDFKGKANSTAIIYGDGKIGAKRLLLVGLGEEKKANIDTLRKAAAVAAGKAVDLKAKTLAIALYQAVGDKIEPEKAATAMAEGAYYGSYRYDEYITKSENGRAKVLGVEIVDSAGATIKKMDKGVSAGAVIGLAQSYARTIANRPGNVINPPQLAAEAKRVAAKTKGLSCTVFDEKALKQKGMGGILAVGQGSASKPRLIVLKYNPPAGKVKGKLPVVGLVGKAITFDSGGISIKPSANMEQMKFDKSGGVAVIAVMRAVAEMKLPMRIYGFIPSAENLPSATSYRPGDIIKTFSGKTVEIQNTDAEGRMILCDAMNYAAKQKCDVIIDIATLTGACMVALGKYKAGLMGNDEKLIKQLEKAGADSGEAVWPLPSGEEYLAEMKSDIADLKNTGSRWGGACTAAAFLGEFVEKKQWAHLDIAGVDMFETAKNDSGGSGASGFGVRLLTSYLINLCKG